MTIIVKYSCFPCGVRRADLEVPARGDEDVLVWMQATAHRIAQAHRLACPTCRHHQIDELLIPAPPGTDKVGGVQQQ